MKEKLPDNVMELSMAFHRDTRERIERFKNDVKAVDPEIDPERLLLCSLITEVALVASCNYTQESARIALPKLIIQALDRMDLMRKD